VFTFIQYYCIVTLLITVIKIIHHNNRAVCCVQFIVKRQIPLSFLSHRTRGRNPGSLSSGLLQVNKLRGYESYNNKRGEFKKESLGDVVLGDIIYNTSHPIVQMGKDWTQSILKVRTYHPDRYVES